MTVGMAIAMDRLPLCLGPKKFTTPSRRIVPIVMGAIIPCGTPK
ncbi:MAG: hypothetical protein WDN28_14010 [Chthoniobacter sp.]